MQAEERSKREIHTTESLSKKNLQLEEANSNLVKELEQARLEFSSARESKIEFVHASQNLTSELKSLHTTRAELEEKLAESFRTCLLRSLDMCRRTLLFRDNTAASR